MKGDFMLTIYCRVKLISLGYCPQYNLNTAVTSTQIWPIINQCTIAFLLQKLYWYKHFLIPYLPILDLLQGCSPPVHSAGTTDHAAGWVRDGAAEKQLFFFLPYFSEALVVWSSYEEKGLYSMILCVPSNSRYSMIPFRDSVIETTMCAACNHHSASGMSTEKLQACCCWRNWKA